jgi:hypothetical protein
MHAGTLTLACETNSREQIARFATAVADKFRFGFTKPKATEESLSRFRAAFRFGYFYFRKPSQNAR